MKQVIHSMPGFRQSEYQLVLLPHDELRERILSVKKEFAEKFKVRGNIISGSHLALVKFTQPEMHEERLVNRLKTIGMGFQPFKIEIKDFGSYPSHSIFLQVTSRLPIQNLVKELKTAQRLMKSSSADPHFLQEPHFTIARKLAPWQFEQGWLEYSQRSFTARFIADCMLLLKRRQDEKKYQVVQRFEFMNLPVLVKQGELW